MAEPIGKLGLTILAPVGDDCLQESSLADTSKGAGFCVRASVLAGRVNPDGQVSAKTLSMLVMKLPKEKVLELIELSLASKDLRKYIDAFPDQEKQELTALTWYGGDYFFDLDTALEESKRIPPSLTAEYLAGKAPLHSFLIKALEKVEPVG